MGTAHPTPPPPPAVAPFDAKKAKVYQESWAKHLGVSVEETNSIGMKLVLIPPGEFDMGSTPGEIAAEIERAKKDLKETEWEDSLEGYWLNLRTEGPRRRVKIAKPFCLGVYPVPQGDYEKVMGTNPSVFTEKPVDLSTFKPPLSEKERKAREVEVKKSKKFAGKDTSRFPVETVSWEDALEFCRRLSALPGERAAVRTYRLPTQAEWEYACRAGTTTRWYCGDDEASLEECAWYGKNSGWTTHPVGTKRANAWRLCDMAGQVAQWCADSGKRYTHHRVTRGSDYASPSLLCRSAYGSEGLPAYRFPNTGFRVVADMARP